MTIEELDILASYLHSEAIEGPHANHPERKEWMAGRITYAINEDNYLLNRLMACENTDQVLDFLGREYHARITRKEQEDEFGQTGIIKMNE